MNPRHATLAGLAAAIALMGGVAHAQQSIDYHLGTLQFDADGELRVELGALPFTPTRVRFTADWDAAGTGALSRFTSIKMYYVEGGEDMGFFDRSPDGGGFTADPVTITLDENLYHPTRGGVFSDAMELVSGSLASRGKTLAVRFRQHDDFPTTWSNAVLTLSDDARPRQTVKPASFVDLGVLIPVRGGLRLSNFGMDPVDPAWASEPWMESTQAYSMSLWSPTGVAIDAEEAPPVQQSPWFAWPTVRAFVAARGPHFVAVGNWCTYDDHNAVHDFLPYSPSCPQIPPTSNGGEFIVNADAGSNGDWSEAYRGPAVFANQAAMFRFFVGHPADYDLDGDVDADDLAAIETDLGLQDAKADVNYDGARDFFDAAYTLNFLDY